MNSGAIDRPERPGRYEVRVQGRLDPKWSTWLGGVDVQSEADGTTVLAGDLADQSALHGLLARLRDLGLPLISVTRIEADCGAEIPNKTNPNHNTGD
jgi:hypothetical protein